MNECPQHRPGLLASQILRFGAVLLPGLAYRGCISVGEFAIDDTFILGPAIDEAAEGALVWFTDSTSEAQRWSDERVAELMKQQFNVTEDYARHVLTHVDSGYVRYSVPMTEGPPRDTFAIHPFERDSSAETKEQLIQAILATFGTDPKFSGKKQNTEAFLRHAGKQVDAHNTRKAEPYRLVTPIA